MIASNVELPPELSPGRPSKEWYDEQERFAEELMTVDRQLDMSISARGWAYYLEGEGAITKAEIDRAEKEINKLREDGLVPLDIAAPDDARAFHHGGGLEKPGALDSYIRSYLMSVMTGYNYEPSFWETQDCYIMVLVEKIDLRSLFATICEEYNIPIATGKGWSSMNQRGEVVAHCYEAEQRGQTPVLLYCGDFDPPGKRISDTLLKNLNDLREARVPTRDGGYITDWTPKNVVFDRFGLNRETIEEMGLTWINNLITGSGRDLASPSHKDHDKPYVQNWLKRVGERKVEANALLKDADAARKLFRDTVEGYLGSDPKAAYRHEKDRMRARVQDRLRELGLLAEMNDAIEQLGGGW